MVYDYADGLHGKNGQNEQMQDVIENLLKHMPVISFDGSDMKSLSGEELKGIVIYNQSGSMLAKRWKNQSKMINLNLEGMERLRENPELMEKISNIEGFTTFKNEAEIYINRQKKIEDLENNIRDEEDENIRDEMQTELNKLEKEKDNKKDVVNELKDKLIKFIMKIPIFMYLSNFKEASLSDVINKLETDLFIKVTGLTKDDFNEMCQYNLFNKAEIDSAVYQFKECEEMSLKAIDLQGKTEREILQEMEKTRARVRSFPASGLEK